MRFSFSEREQEIRDVCFASGLFAPSFPVELGVALGKQVLLEEQLDRVSSCVWSVLWWSANVPSQSTNARRERYLLPSLLGEFGGESATTEPNARSDVSRLETVAVPIEGGNRLTGEK